MHREEILERLLADVEWGYWAEPESATLRRAASKLGMDQQLEDPDDALVHRAWTMARELIYEQDGLDKIPEDDPDIAIVEAWANDALLQAFGAAWEILTREAAQILGHEIEYDPYSLVWATALIKAEIQRGN